MVDLRNLERIAENALAAVGYDLVDLEFQRDGQGWVFRVFIDHPHEGRAMRDDAPRRVTLSDCTKATRQLGTVLDVEDPIDAAYRLEVSSPGVLRSLRKKRDFERFVGWQVKVKLRDGLEGRRNFTGRLVAVDDQHLRVEVDGAEHALPLAELAKARLDEEY
ncbi:MAG: ribosome maturation factor RimP [Proteobacteria bacterium]|nr:MAG: ribosome maturation factor RimP [Pseudomonadota bacterium]PIE18886.1 MAG: ribosome maturation factor RimP [Pseudomonadota bacterium]